jgi:hypothetical protein
MMTITLNNLPSNANLLGYSCTFRVGHGTHARTYQSESSEAKALCEAVMATHNLLHPDDYPPNQLSRLIGRAKKRFGVEFAPILEATWRKRGKGRINDKVAAYELITSVHVMELRVVISMPLLTLPNGGAR